MNDIKIKTLLIDKLTQCKEDKDYVLVLNNKIVSSTQHLNSRKSLDMLKHQAKGIINPYKLNQISELHWGNSDKTLVIRKFKNEDLITLKRES